MKKTVLSLCLILLVLPTVLAIDIDVQKNNPEAVMIAGVDNPVTFELEITNNGAGGNFNIYNLLGFGMTPKEDFYIAHGETKNIELSIFPRVGFDYRGFYTLNYFIKSQDGTETQQEATFKIIDLGDAFEIDSTEITPESTSATVYIKNKLDMDFGDIKADFNSPFFEKQSEEFTLGPKESKEFEVELDKEKFKSLLAGFYTVTANLETGGREGTAEGTVKFSEKDILDTSDKDYGFLIHTRLIEKTNSGNTVAQSQTVVKKNIISRLFTSFSPEPDIAERKGFTVYYTWESSVEPGDTLKITVKTNWLLPLVVILLVVAIVVLTKQYTKTNLDMKKKVSFVKAKGGEFALKVTITVNARKYVERVCVTERFPPIVKVYERFGHEKPTRFDEKTRRIEWNFDHLEQGETRVLSYVLYSKVGVVGKFALPTATAVYEKEGNIHEAESNRAFFVVEQKQEDKRE